MSASSYCPPQHIVHLHILSTSTYYPPQHIVHLNIITTSKCCPIILPTSSFCPPHHIVHLIILSTSTYPPQHIIHLIILSTSTYCPPQHIVHLNILSTSSFCPPHHIVHHNILSTSTYYPPQNVVLSFCPPQHIIHLNILSTSSYYPPQNVVLLSFCPPQHIVHIVDFLTPMLIFLFNSMVPMLSWSTMKGTVQHSMPPVTKQTNANDSWNLKKTLRKHLRISSNKYYDTRTFNPFSLVKVYKRFSRLNVETGRNQDAWQLFQSTCLSVLHLFLHTRCSAKKFPACLSVVPYDCKFNETVFCHTRLCRK